uniref:Sialate O-acetylesterase domain-containing protein n=1 Tax=Arion vulgaris TaxID=1028688 RepID=A0A0B7A1T8_9EUPU
MQRAHIKLIAVVLLILPISIGGNIIRMSVKEYEEVSFKEHLTVKNEAPNVIFALAKHFQDHMVLQKAPARANIYGFSPDIGKSVLVSMQISPSHTYTYETTVIPGSSPDIGVWNVLLDPMVAGSSVNITAQSQGQSYIITDVIFGDVWLCSGQSNMQFTTVQMFGAAAEIADAQNYPNIRLMTVYEKVSSTPLDDLLKIQQNWTRPDNVSVGGPSWKYFSAVCWLYGKAIHKALGYPIGLVATDWGGTPVEAWSSPEALAKCGIHGKTKIKQPDSFIKYVESLPPSERHNLQGPDDNSQLWNAMIHPFLNMTIYGAIWYQGEADADGVKMNNYNCTFPTMIRDWRKNFYLFSGGQTDPIFPFGFVQLAPNSPNQSITVGFPDVRWHQTADHGFVPNQDMINVFMAVAIDLPDFNSTYGSIHPCDKMDVGDRLCLSGLAVAYERSEVFQGPFPIQGEVTPQGLKILYGDKWSLEVRDTNGFELRCDSDNWVPSAVIGSDITSVTIQANVCPQGENPTGIRYNWKESPCAFKKCAVYETVNGLPGPPFVIVDSVNIDGRPLFKFNGPVHI